MIEKYFKNIDEAISYFNSIKRYSLNKSIYNDKQGFINGEIVFKDDSQLDFTEVKNVDFKEKIRYRYHYMDKNKDLIFRYDNAPHFKKLSTFPHHKHTTKTVIESLEKELLDILMEIHEIVKV